MSKSGQYVLEQQTKACEKGEPDINHLSPEEVMELDKWLDWVNEQLAEASDENI